MIALAAAIVATIGIIWYAYSQHNVQVNGAAVASSPGPNLPTPLPVGAKAPFFSVTARGVPISSLTLGGKPFLLEIFATWCPHCQRMTTVLRDIRAKFPPSRFGMVSVTGSPYAMTSNADQTIPESESDVEQFEQTYNVTWPSAFDQNLTLAKTWGLGGFPTIFIVDAHGKIVYVHSGEIDESVLVKAITSAGG